MYAKKMKGKEREKIQKKMKRNKRLNKKYYMKN
jgi:hypothetical protein